ncbi:MAG: hypothetical protein OXG57_13665 [Acidimicrobiaceae bacterium]|nr:hypothetical protein [Acidimicrobiaceae bacterium]
MNTIRQRLRAVLARTRRDTRGVALQTVIVIVVLLMIAGGVSAVLLSRSSDVVGQLEAQGVGALTEDNCAITRVGGEVGVASTAAAKINGTVLNTTGATHKLCVWIADISDAQCFAAANGKTFETASAATVAGVSGLETSLPSGQTHQGCASEIAAT